METFKFIAGVHKQPSDEAYTRGSEAETEEEIKNQLSKKIKSGMVNGIQSAIGITSQSMQINPNVQNQ